MRTFAYIFNPLNIEQLKDIWPMVRILPDFLIRNSLKKSQPFKISYVKKILSAQGNTIEGYFILCPLLPEDFLEQDKVVLNKVTAAAGLAEHYGAKIAGLGGYTSIVAEDGYPIAKKIKIPVTSGDTFSAWSVFEAVYRIARARKIDLAISSLAVIGAATAVGRLTAIKLSEYFPRITIAAKEQEKLASLKEAILHLNYVDVLIKDDVSSAVGDVNIVVNASNSPELSINLNDLMPGTIVFDASTSKDLVRNAVQYPKITVIECGLIKLPYPFDLEINFGLPKNVIPAALAETMLLAFEERFVSYSLGDNINPDKLEEIADIAALHGLEVWLPQAPVL